MVINSFKITILFFQITNLLHTLKMLTSHFLKKRYLEKTGFDEGTNFKQELSTA